MTVTLKIDGMTCQHCVRHLTETLNGMPGVEAKRVVIGEADVSFDPAQTSAESIANALRKVAPRGMQVTVK